MAFQKMYEDQLKAQLEFINQSKVLDGRFKDQTIKDSLDKLKIEIDKYNSEIAALDVANKGKLELIRKYEKEKNDIINKSSDELSEQNKKRYEEEIARITAEYDARIMAVNQTAADRLQAQVIEQELLQQAEEKKNETLEYYKNLNKEQIQEQVDATQSKIDKLNQEVETNQLAQQSISETLAASMAEQSKIQEEANLS